MSGVTIKKIKDFISKDFSDEPYNLGDKWHEVEKREEEYDANLIDQGLLVVESATDDTGKMIIYYHFQTIETFAKYIKWIHENMPEEYIIDLANYRKHHGFKGTHEFIFVKD